MKLIAEITNINQISYLKNKENFKYILIGIKDISLNPAKCFSEEALNEIIVKSKKYNLGIILNAERLFTDYELNLVLPFINKYINDFSFITYSDFGLYEALKLYKEKLIFRAPTYLTNSYDCNIYSNFNKYIVVSNQITIDELNVICDSLENKVIVDLFGKEAIFNSRRPLISTYFKYRSSNLDPYKDNFHVVEEIRTCENRILEDETGTHIFEPKYYHLMLNNKNIEYGIIHTKFLTLNKINCLFDAYNTYYSDYNLTKFYQSLKEEKIEFYQGAYDIKSILLKGDE